MPAGFITALKRHSTELQRLEGAQADEFLRLLKGLREEVQGRLLSSEDGGAALNVFSLRRVIAETEVGIKTLEAKAHQQYDKASRESVDLAIEHMGDELDRMSFAFDKTPIDVSIDAAQALADPVQGLLANHFETSVARYGGELLNGVRQRLFIGIRAGDSVGSIVRDIAGRKGPLGEVGRANAQRLVRTEVSQSYGAAQHSGLAQAAKQVPALKKVWLHVGSFLCPTCGPLHGTERPLNGTWTIRQGSRTKEVAHAPAHPRCSCRVAGMKSAWRKGLKDLGYLGEQPATGEEGQAQL